MAERDPQEIVREQQLLWVLGHKQQGLEPGSFYKALIEAALRADPQNIVKISTVFPNTTRAIMRWRRGDLAEEYGISDG